MRDQLRSALRSLGIALRDDWLAACDAHLRATHPGFDAMPHDRQARGCSAHQAHQAQKTARALTLHRPAPQVELAYAQFLQCDLNTAGVATLPDVEAMHEQQLVGRFVLQLDEAANIGVAARERYAERERRAGDCYKLSLTDGARRVVGFEHAALPWLRHDTPAGAKVAVTHAHVRRGLLLLTPQCAELLGGCAPRLEAARVRAVERWNAPPGCAAIDAAARRRAAATAAPGAAPPPPPSLAEAAAEAAWAPEAGQPPAVRGPPPAPAPAPAFAPSHHAPQQQQQPPRQQQAVPQVVSLLDDDDEDAPLGARLQRLRAGPSGDSPPLPPPQHQHAPPQPPPAHAPPQQQRREAPPPGQQQQRPPPQPPPLEPVAVRAASPVAMAGAFGGSHQAPLPGSGSKSGTSQRRPPWERFSGEPFTYIAALQAQAAAGGPFPARGCIHGYVWTVQHFKYLGASNEPLPAFDLLVTLEDGSGSASAAFSNAAVAEHVGATSPAALQAALQPDAPGREDMRARFGRFEALLRSHVGGLDLEIPAQGAVMRVTRLRADVRDAADAAAAAARREAEASRAAYALLERLGRNGC